MIYLTADLHFCHYKPFIYEPRGFDSVEQMNEGIIRNWNEIVKPEDEVYVLGDIMLKDNEKGIECWNRLNGTKHIILGNHDTSPRVALYKAAPDTIVEGYAMPFVYHHHNFFLSHYPTLTTNFDVEEPLKKRVINLCGHVHTMDRFSDFDKGLIYHVELNAHHNRPVSIDQIIEDINNKLGLGTEVQHLKEQ